MLSQDPFVPALNQFEINVAAAIEETGDTREIASILDINYGLLNNVQLTIEGAYVDAETQDDFDAMELALKWNFYQNDFFAIAVNPRYLSYPIRSVFDEGEVLELSLPMSFALNDALNWVVDILYVKPKDGSEHMELGTYLQYTQTNHNYYLELYMEESEADDEIYSLLNLGYLYQFHNNIAFMISIGRETHAEDQKSTIAYSGLQFVF